MLEYTVRSERSLFFCFSCFCSFVCSLVSLASVLPFFCFFFSCSVCVKQPLSTESSPLLMLAHSSLPPLVTLYLHIISFPPVFLPSFTQPVFSDIFCTGFTVFDILSSRQVGLGPGFRVATVNTQHTQMVHLDLRSRDPHSIQKEKLKFLKFRLRLRTFEPFSLIIIQF